MNNREHFVPFSLHINRKTPEGDFFYLIKYRFKNNLLALIGVSWNGILYAIKTSNVWAGIAVSAVMYIITYLLPTQIIPYFIQKVQKKIDNWLSIDYKDKERFKWEAYISGGLFVIVLILLEGLVIKWYIDSLK